MENTDYRVIQNFDYVHQLLLLDALHVVVSGWHHIPFTDMHVSFSLSPNHATEPDRNTDRVNYHANMTTEERLPEGGASSRTLPLLVSGDANDTVGDGGGLGAARWHLQQRCSERFSVAISHG